MTNDAPAQASVEITDEVIARVADAIDRATVGYSLRLTRLVDEESTYTLTYEDGERHEFPDIDDGYAHVRQRKLRAQAANVIAALSPPPTVGAEDEAPVAWMWTHEDGTRAFVSDLDTKRIWEGTMKRVLVPVYTRPSPSAVEVKGTDAPMLSRNDVCRLWQHVARERPNMTVEGFTNMLLCEIDDRSCIASEKGGA